MGILILLAGVLTTSASVLLTGFAMRRRVMGAPRPGPLVPNWIVAVGLVGVAMFVAGLVITLGNLV